MLGCPDDNTLVQLLERRLDDAAAAAVRAHVDACPACLQLLAALGAAAADADSAPASAADSAGPLPECIEEYRLLRPLGQGAMGEVHLAHDTRLDRQVAIKFIADVSSASDEAARSRFLVEARAIARLTHPNVVGIYRVGEVQGRPYLVTEYVRGQSLAQLPKPLSTQPLLKIARGLCCGLAAAHRCGVLHRDLKPANAILTDDGQVKLLDFGLAKLLDPAQRPLPDTRSPAADPAGTEPDFPAPALLRTASGVLIGTPAYLAPELWQGAAATCHSDLYSLGALLYELASGAAPHQAKTLAELRRCAREHDARPLAAAAPGIDDRLAALIDRCLQRQPAQRFASADELHSALEQLATAQDPPPLPAAVPSRRARGPLLAAALVVPLGIALAAYSLAPRRNSAGPPARLRAVDPHLRAQVSDPLPIPADQQRLLEAMDRYVQEGPESAELPSIKFRRANTLYGYHHYREAIPLLRDVAENHPAHEAAVPAANLLLDCLYLLKEQDALAQQVDRLLAIPELRKDTQLRTMLEKLQQRLPARKAVLTAPQKIL